jgi:hypothetical protein
MDFDSNINGVVLIDSNGNEIPLQAILEAMSNQIGLTTDEENVDSVLARLYVISKHLHSVGMVYPLLANPVTLTKDAGIWSAFKTVKTEVIPANTIIKPFDIHFANITNLSAIGNYVIALYYGEAGSEVLCGYAIATRTAIGGTEGTCPVTSAGNALHDLIPANSRISAAVTSGNATADTLGVKLHYHTY